MMFQVVNLKCNNGEKWADPYVDKPSEHLDRRYRFATNFYKWDVLAKRIFDPINELCGGLLDLCDVDMFGSNDAKKILEYIESQEGIDDIEEVKDIFYILKFFCKKTIEQDYHLLIEC